VLIIPLTFFNFSSSINNEKFLNNSNINDIFHREKGQTNNLLTNHGGDFPHPGETSSPKLPTNR
jgi:hypothetical protein